jgi:hypothetical protein
MPITGILTGLSRIENKIGREVEREIGICAYTLIETAAKNKLTMDRHVVTGRLRASIRTVLDNSSFIKRATISTNVPYAAKIEYRFDSYMAWSFETNKTQINSKISAAFSRSIR